MISRNVTTRGLCPQSIYGVLFGALLSGSAVHADELKTINYLGTNDASCSAYPYIVMEEFGFLQEEGYKLNVLSANTTVPFVAFLANGDADISMMDSASIVRAVDAGQPVKAVYEAYQRGHRGVYASGTSDIKRIEDLRGKTVGLTTDRDRSTLAVALQTAGISIDEVQNVVVGDSIPTLMRSFENGSIDALTASIVESFGLAAAGMRVRDLTPEDYVNVPGNTVAVWGPTLEEKRPMIQAFLRAWAKAQQSGVMDTKAIMAACEKRIPEQWENRETGESMVNNSVYHTQLRRTMKLGELQPEAWTRLQAPYVALGEISRQIDPAEFLDASFVEEANGFTTDDVKAGIKRFRESNSDLAAQ